jgi:filamentous hemagglutinin
MVTFRWLTVFGIGCSQFRPISKSIPVGTRLDRYGPENGNFLSPAGTPYEQRSLPPDTDRKDHTVYEVIKALPVVSGQTAAWFGQPGGGVQHYTKGLSNVAYLKFQEYLKEIKP